MEHGETGGNPKAKDPRGQRHRYISVLDSRNRKVRGLWLRNGRYYVQYWVTGEKSPRRSRLEATTLEAAKKEMAAVSQQRDQGDLPSRERKPFFAELVSEYIEFLESVVQKQRDPAAMHKSVATVQKEKGNLALWSAHFGHVRVDQITRPMIVSLREKRLAAGIKPRTVNLDLIMLRNVLKRAVDAGHLRKLPTEGIKSFKFKSPRREMLEPAQVSRLIDAAKTAGRNGAQLSNYLRLLAFTGAREQDALRLPWTAVNFKGETITVVISKNGETREVEFNGELRKLLLEMAAKRVPDCYFLFPSPRRGGKNKHIANFRAAFNVARVKAGLPEAGFHDLRHYFASMAVMSGIDFMTVSHWLGHKDGGILVGKVYGHVLKEHKRASADKLAFKLEAQE